MTLNLTFATCWVCERHLAETRDVLDLDQVDEEGRRSAGDSGWAGRDYVLPPANMRDKLAPDICDKCWSDHRTEMFRVGAFRRHGIIPPFRTEYFWGWVASVLKSEADVMLRTDRDRRLTAAKAELADKGLGITRAGPRRTYGPRKLVYKRSIYG